MKKLIPGNILPYLVRDFQNFGSAALLPFSLSAAITDVFNRRLTSWHEFGGHNAVIGRSDDSERTGRKLKWFAWLLAGSSSKKGQLYWRHGVTHNIIMYIIIAFRHGPSRHIGKGWQRHKVVSTKAYLQICAVIAFCSPQSSSLCCSLCSPPHAMNRLCTFFLGIPNP